ncbi:hypothetical protein P170DRAFT_433994 [Aspergillus steynii IBT 23096]|uniref:Uncharacterized protein n=1 Tax=Aspergillus steynii IBT 23096 TaxID=1392250 RepID=A0A2I2GGZ5_9EURO|nr:uncharacterized protein P170DRAFT_433994 [Aspergillus steynii IBT 23096]PLB52155.1 hypothetical protein P170DRAFT_433994 [Aspergillus steynii IBT 23096]
MFYRSAWEVSSCRDRPGSPPVLATGSAGLRQRVGALEFPSTVVGSAEGDNQN